MVLLILPDAKGHEIASIQFQIGPTAENDIMKWKFVVDIQLRGPATGNAFWMGGTESFFDFRPCRAPSQAELLLNGLVCCPMAGNRHGGEILRQKIG